MKDISIRKGGITILFQGNEAIARGALEAGVRFCASYPGNPSSEIMETLIDASKQLPIYVEWSVNEKVALEAATAASFSGLRALVSMKQNGVNVVSDFLTNLTLSGIKAGLVLVACDDPGGISSTNEEDSRWFSKLSDIPLLEPATPQEALEITKWAFELSEEIKNVVIVRSVSRLSHTRADVRINDLPDVEAKPYFDTKSPFHTFPVLLKHQKRHDGLKKAETLFENSKFNIYQGPDNPELLIITSGTSWTYALEAIEILGIQDRTGILKLGTTWPVPKTLLKEHIKSSKKVLFLEDVDPFIEESVMAIASGMGDEIGPKEFLGKLSGHLPGWGEQSPERVIQALGNIFDLRWENTQFRESIEDETRDMIPFREFGFCPGCPHRGSMYAIKTALSCFGGDGFVSGDIGCYTMAIWPTGFNQVKSVHAMGSGAGLACGYGKLDMFGFSQPVITVCGDSTFYHASVPALINAKFNKSDMFMVVLDNSATAMTGFQPHPGTGITAMGKATDRLDVEDVCRGLGIHVEIGDPYNLKESADQIYQLLKKKGPRVLIMRRKCALVQGREGGFPYKMEVNQEQCRGEECGCNRYCTRIFRCPGLIWDKESQRAKIDEVICVGCGICADICPQGAIKRLEIKT